MIMRTYYGTKLQKLIIGSGLYLITNWMSTIVNRATNRLSCSLYGNKELKYDKCLGLYQFLEAFSTFYCLIFPYCPDIKFISEIQKI